MDMQPNIHLLQDNGQAPAAPQRPPAEPVFDIAAFAALARFAGIPQAGRGEAGRPR